MAKSKITMPPVLAKPVLPVVPVQTVIAQYPPLRGISSSGLAGVTGGNSSTGHGVLGTSDGGDGVHGETKGAGMSAVAGLHTAGGNGVYGRSSGNAGCFDGNVQVNGNLTVTGDVYLPGADCAEQFDTVTGEGIEPGTLVVVDDGGAVRVSATAYDRKVAGVVAGAGRYRPGIVLDKQSADSVLSRVNLSLIGKAYCKVDAGYAAIEVGDMLTSSPTEGYAMKASDPTRAFGAVVGKALCSMESGRGMIPILMALQ